MARKRRIHLLEFKLEAIRLLEDGDRKISEVARDLDITPGLLRTWRHLEAVGFATLVWVDWFNNRRLLEPLGHIPPQEFEEAWYSSQEVPVDLVGLT